MYAFIKYGYVGDGNQSQGGYGLNFDYHGYNNQPCVLDSYQHDPYHNPSLEAMMIQFMASQEEYQKKNDERLENLGRLLNQVSNQLGEIPRKDQVVSLFDDEEECVIESFLQILEGDEFIRQVSCEEEGEQGASEDENLSCSPNDVLEETIKSSCIHFPLPRLHPRTDIGEFLDYIWDTFPQRNAQSPLLDEIKRISQDAQLLELSSGLKEVSNPFKHIYWGNIILVNELVDGRKKKVRKKESLSGLVNSSTPLAIKSNATNPYDPG